MGNDRKPSYSFCIVIKPKNFKILSSLLHGYHTQELKNIAIPNRVSSLHNFKILSTLHKEFFGLVIPL